MYSIVLMAATTAGPATPAADNTPVVVAAPVAAGCCGGSVAVGCCGGYSVGCGGSCYGGYSSGCCGGRGGLFHRHKASYGCCGGYAPSYGCCGGWACFGSSAYAAWGGCYGTVTYGRSAGGCWGTVYGGGYGCWGSSYGSGGYAPPAVVIPVETAPAVPANPATDPAPKTNPLPKSGETPKGGAGKDGASLRFQLPPTAALFVDGNRVAGAGADRAFYTPPLQAGQRYFYDVRAEVVVNGQTVTEEKRVVVTAGADLVETFPRLIAATAGPATVAGR
jgi:uncharacterized protein (TIGR03000 family)